MRLIKTAPTSKYVDDVLLVGYMQAVPIAWILLAGRNSIEIN